MYVVVKCNECETFLSKSQYFNHLTSTHKLSSSQAAKLVDKAKKFSYVDVLRQIDGMKANENTALPRFLIMEKRIKLEMNKLGI